MADREKKLIEKPLEKINLARRLFVQRLSLVMAATRVIPSFWKALAGFFSALFFAKTSEGHGPPFAFWKTSASSTTPMQTTQVAVRIVSIGGPGSMRTTQAAARVVAVGGPGTMRTTQAAARVVAVGGPGTMRTTQLMAKVVVKP